jgi:zinc transporter ZupT
MIYFIAIAAFLCTILGGILALRFKDKLHLVLGFSAGTVLGVTFFDLMPEAVHILGDQGERFAFVLIAAGFSLFMILDRLFIPHGHRDEEHVGRSAGYKSIFEVVALACHSFLDGLAIGLAYKVSPLLGSVVAIAVLAHGFSDGINAVGLILRAGSKKRKAFMWLLVDAMAPVLGITAAFFVSVNEVGLGIVLALFSGSFLYIGASDLLPESHHEHPTYWTTAMTVLGAGLIFLIVNFAHI